MRKHELKYLIKNPIHGNNVTGQPDYYYDYKFWFDIEYVENYNKAIYNDWFDEIRKVSNTGFRLILHINRFKGVYTDLELTHPVLFATYEDACNFRDYLAESNKDYNFEGLMVTNWYWDEDDPATDYIFDGAFNAHKPTVLEYVPTSLTD